MLKGISASGKNAPVVAYGSQGYKGYLKKAVMYGHVILMDGTWKRAKLKVILPSHGADQDFSVRWLQEIIELSWNGETDAS